MGKTQAGPCLRQRRISFGCLRENGNRRFPTPKVKEGDPQIAEDGRPPRRERLATFEAGAGRLESAVRVMLDALEKQGARPRDLLFGRTAVNSHIGLPKRLAGCRSAVRFQGGCSEVRLSRVGGQANVA